ncbi:MAG: hypothetical protein DWQ04_31550 [Chloroflexi bacterium]|nr:MAG: hypothetical protein DWQ04_31550 [Chloroflexota bacterium]
MSETIVEKTDSSHLTHYQSLFEMRAEHARLVQLRRSDGITPSFLEQILTFIKRGKGIGVLLDTVKDRQAGQSLLDYWENVLNRKGDESIDPTLDEFDPLLSPEIPDDKCPFLGLDAFRVDNKKYFFGRHRLVEQLIQHLQDNRLLAVVGPSGSGKSSVVLAGLLPVLQNDGIDGSQTWDYLQPFVPGSRPLLNLARAIRPKGSRYDWASRQVKLFLNDPTQLATLLSERESSEPVVVVIDQFEELFTLCQNENESEAFVQNLMQVVRNENGRNFIILTMRTDFEANIARFPTFQPLFESALISIMPLSASELRDAIERPAEIVGLKFEEGVVDALLKDILGEPAALPLLQFTLLKLWEKRQRNRVTWEAYQQLEGGRRALANSADELYDALITEDQNTVKNILLRMVRPGEGLEVTSNRVRRSVLYEAGIANDRVDRVLQRLVDARLVRRITGDSVENEQVELAHEALVRNWPRLVEWLEDERENIRRRLRFTAAAEQWESMGRDKSVLLRGLVLAEALTFSNLNPLEDAFIVASRTAVADEEAEKRAVQERQLAQANELAETQRKRAEEREISNKRLSILAVALAVLVFILIFATGSARKNRNIADQNANDAKLAQELETEARATAEASAVLAVEAQQLEASARAAAEASAQLAEENAQQAAENEALAVEAQKLEAEARVAAEANALLAEEAKNEAERQAQEVIARNLVNNANEQRESNPELSLLLALEAVNIGLSSDDPVPNVAAESLYQILQSFQLKRVFSGHEDEVSDLAFSPDGTRLATTSLDRTVKIWDVATGQNLLALGEHKSVVTSVSFNQDGTILATGSLNGFIILWNVETGGLINVLGSSNVAVHSVSFHTDGIRLVAGYDDGTVRVWNRRTFRSELVLTGHVGAVSDVVFNRDGTRFASVGEDGRIILWRAEDGFLIYSVNAESGEDENPLIVNTVAFTASGDRLITGNEDGSIKIWDVESGQFLQKILAHTSAVYDIKVNGDGTRFATASGDGTVKVWDINTSQTLFALLGHEGVVTAVSFSADDQWLATASQDRTARVWRAETVLSPQFLTGHRDTVNHLSFSPQNDLVATASNDNTARIWRLEDGQMLFDLGKHNSAVRDVVFSPDGELLVTSGDDGVAWIWDVMTGESVAALVDHGGPVTAVSFNSDGTLLATASDDGFVRVWDRDTWSIQFEINHRHLIEDDTVSVRAVVFHPNGEQLLSGDNLGNVVLWDVDGETAVSQWLAHEEAVVNDIAFNPGGSQFATAGSDGVVRLWSTDLEEPISTLVGHSGAVWSVTFYQDGERVATASADSTVKLWDSSSSQLLRTIAAHRAPVRDVAVSNDGLRIATASADRTAQISTLDMAEDLFAKANGLVTRSLTVEECKVYMPESTCPTVFPISP